MARTDETPSLTCRSCGRDSPAGAAFCIGCGAPLTARDRVDPRFGAPLHYTPEPLARRILASRPLVEGENKTVTVLFLDVVGSTAITERIGEEAMAGLLDRLFALALEEIHRSEGTITQFMGDGFIALFGAPLAHEDDPERATRAAWEIAQRLEREPLVIPGEPEAQLRTRMGLHTGEVVVGTIGDELRMEYTAVGDTVNLAARLEAEAEPGTIYLSAATREHVGPNVAAESLGARTMRGRRQPVEVFRLAHVAPSGQPPARTPLGTRRMPLVGRGNELDELDGAVGRVEHGRGGLVLVWGEPGVGKSRLVAEARAKASSRQVEWLEGRTMSFGRSIGFWPFQQVLREWSNVTEDDSEGQELDKLEAQVLELFGDDSDEVLPYLAALLGLRLPGPRGERLERLDSRSVGVQVNRSMWRLMEALSRRRPLVLVFEDLQWADRSSLDLLVHLLPLTERVPLLVVGVSRAQEGEALEELRESARPRAANPIEIPLDPLEQDESAELLLNIAGPGGLGADTTDLLLARSGGNPFFLEELVRSLLAAGVLQVDSEGGVRLVGEIGEQTVPQTVQEVIVARLDRLDDDLKGVLRVAAVIGRTFSRRVLEVVTDAPGGHEAALSELVRLELIRLRRDDPEPEYIFTHVLVQEATYRGMLHARRQQLHNRTGAAIEHLSADRLEEFYGLLAHHYVEAGNWEKAHRYLGLASAEAGRIAADQEALGFYRRALESSEQQWTPLERAHLESSVGEALFRIGEHGEAIGHLRRASQLLGAPYPSTRLGFARRLSGEIGGRLFRNVIRRGHVETDDNACAALDQAFRTYYALAMIDSNEGPIPFALDALTGLRTAERRGSLEDTAVSAAAIGFVLAHVPLRRLADRYFDRAFAEAQESEDPHAFGVASVLFGMRMQLAGEFDEAVRRYDHAEHALWGTGDLRAWGMAVTMRAWTLRLQGRFAETLSEVDRVGRTAREASDRELLAWRTQTRGHTLWRAGAIEPASELLAEAIDEYRAIPSTMNLVCALADLAECRRRQGRLEEALELLSESERLVDERQFRGFAVWLTPVVAAQVRLDIAESSSGAERRAALREARRRLRRATRSSRAAVEAVPAVLRVRGTYEWLRGRTRRADRLWRESAARAEALGANYELAATDLEVGRRREDGERRERGERRLAEVSAGLAEDSR